MATEDVRTAARKVPHTYKGHPNCKKKVGRKIGDLILITVIYFISVFVVVII